MPQLIPIVINDGTNDRTFAPRGIDAKGVTTLVESTGVPVGDRRLTVQRTRTSQGREKVTFKFTIPVIKTVTSGDTEETTVLRTNYADISFSFDSTSTQEERADIRQWIMDLMGTSNPTGDLVDLLGYLY